MSDQLPVHRVETTLKQDGTLTIDRLPFQAGQAVEVIVVPRAIPNGTVAGSLRGTAVRYDRPFDPVAEDEWDATR
jgi:hypothetical protein